MTEAVSLLGLRFANLDVEHAGCWLASRPADAPFGYVTTPNADHLVRLHRRPELLPLYRNSLLCLLDSRVVARGGHLLGLRVPHVTPGSDLTQHLLTHRLLRRERITIIGLRPDWLPALMAACNLATPAHYDPPMGFDRDPRAMQATVEFVLVHPARFVFLAVGSPQQERLAAAIQATGQATGVGLCVGASLEFLTGYVTRAPEWMQHAGLEWLHRLSGDPLRLARRYLRDSPAIFPLLLRQRLGLIPAE